MDFFLSTTNDIEVAKKTIKVVYLKSKYLMMKMSKRIQPNWLEDQSNQIGEDGVKYFANSINKNQTLHTIYISGNLIGEIRANYFDMALFKNQSLKLINIGWNQIGENGAKYIAIDLEKNHHYIQFIQMESR